MEIVDPAGSGRYPSDNVQLPDGGPCDDERGLAATNNKFRGDEAHTPNDTPVDGTPDPARDSAMRRKRRLRRSNRHWIFQSSAEFFKLRDDTNETFLTEVVSSCIHTRSVAMH